VLTKSLLVSLLADIFRRSVGKWQNEAREPEPKALCFSFALSVDCEKEEGYRHLKVVVFAPDNYVQVWSQETWCVRPVEDGEAPAKPSTSYEEGAGDWKKEADHDSCWPEGLRRVFDRYDDKVLYFDGPDAYQIRPVRDTGIPLPKSWGRP
jgi:hypothetical protein